jgi:hypothetical protein
MSAALAPSIFWSSRKSSTQAFHSSTRNHACVRDGSTARYSATFRPSEKETVWEPARLPSGHRTCGLQLIQRSESQKVGQHCLRTTHPPPSVVIVIMLLCPPQADYVRRRVMRDCGVALPYARLVACAVTLAIFRVCWMRSVMVDITAPVRAHQADRHHVGALNRVLMLLSGAYGYPGSCFSGSCSCSTCLRSDQHRGPGAYRK